MAFSPKSAQTHTAKLRLDFAGQVKREWAQGDVETLRANLLQSGIDASYDTVFGAWERYSDSHAAGWLQLYDRPEDNVRALLQCLDLS
jgi:hypothetical protein